MVVNFLLIVSINKKQNFSIITNSIGENIDFDLLDEQSNSIMSGGSIYDVIPPDSDSFETSREAILSPDNQ